MCLQTSGQGSCIFPVNTIRESVEVEKACNTGIIIAIQ